MTLQLEKPEFWPDSPSKSARQEDRSLRFLAGRESFFATCVEFDVL